ncbi:MAG: hypothetical protein ACR2QR_05115 [Woeseiaceae bacterium]
MDTYLEQLIEFAGIAITLTGFSALISVVGTSVSTSDTMVDKFRALLLVVCGLTAVSLMLLPVVLTHFFDDITVWRYASAFALVAAFSLGIWGLIWVREYHSVFTTLDKIITASSYVLCAALLGVLVAIVLGAVGDNSGPFYMAAMFLAILILGLLFVGIATSVLLPGIHGDRS